MDARKEVKLHSFIKMEEMSEQSVEDRNSALHELIAFEKFSQQNTDTIKLLQNQFPDLFRPIHYLQQQYLAKVLDICVYRTKENKIKLCFNVITEIKRDSLIQDILPNNLHKQLKYNRDPQYFNESNEMGRILEELIHYSDCNHSMFTNNQIKTTAIHDAGQTTYYLSCFKCDLSTQPHIVLNWMGCLALYLKNNLSRFDSVHIRQMHHLSLTDHDHNILSMNEYIKFENIKKDYILVRLLENITLLKSETIINDPYSEVINAIETIMDYGKNINPDKPFIEHIKMSNYCNILYKETTEQIFDSIISLPQKQTALLKIARELLAKNQKQELNYYFNCINHLLRKNLYALCIGKKTQNKDYYDWTYAEWDFLQYAEFKLKNDKLCIVNIQNNPGYQYNYSSGKQYHEIFQSEMEFLVKTLDLEIEPGCNFHSEINFTEASTKKLQAMGFCLTEQAKALMYKENFWFFFRRSRIDQLNAKVNILALAEDTMDQIQNEMEKLRYD